MDSSFHNLLIMMRTGLMGCQLDMIEGAGFASPFSGERCAYRAGNGRDLGVHVNKHPMETRIYLENLGVFWGAVICYYLVGKYMPQPHALGSRVCLSSQYISTIWSFRKAK
jgi:hypothetical protein